MIDKCKNIVRLDFLMLSVLIYASIGYSAVEKKPYLLFEGSNTQMTVMWQLTNTQSCKIRWGQTESYEMGEASTSEYGSDHQHKYTIKDLGANRVYHYSIDGVGEGSFRNAPAASTARTRFFAYGDTRLDKDDNGQNDHDSVAARILKRIDEQPALQTAVIFSGDYVGTGRDESHWKNQFFNISHKNQMELHAKVPNIGAIGNHEGPGGSKLLKKYYPFPHVDKDMHYWAFNYGSARVFVLDQFSQSDYIISPKTDQYKWLESELASCDREWKIVAFHRPGYSAAGGHDNDKDIQTHLQPLFEDYGVDFVITGDNHYYSRAVVKGVQHITTGGGGAPLRGPDKSQPFIVKTDKSNHFCEFDLNGPVATVIARRADGSVIESFKVKHENSAPIIVYAPEDDTVDVGEEYALGLTSKDADDFEIHKWTLAINGSAIPKFDGTYKWLVPVDSVGLNTFVATVIDRGGLSDTASWTVFVRDAVALDNMGNNAQNFNLSSRFVAGQIKTTIQLENNSRVSVALFNSKGQQIFSRSSENLSKGFHDIRIPFEFSSGVYLLRVKVNGQEKTSLLNCMRNIR